MSDRIEALLIRLVEQQAETNALLALLLEEQRALVNALAEDDELDIEPTTYLDGTPICR